MQYNIIYTYIYKLLYLAYYTILYLPYDIYKYAVLIIFLEVGYLRNINKFYSE